MECPRCQAVLSEIMLDEIVLDRCSQCGGIWFDFAEFERILSRESRVIQALLPEGGTTEPEEAHELPCPRCNGTLIRMGAPTGPTSYYGCLTCYGRWLDGNEIERMLGRSLAIKFEKLFQELLD